MKKLSLITLLFCSVFTTKAQNLILNGSFELNSSINCDDELQTKIQYESTVPYSYHFGDENTISLIKDSCVMCAFSPNPEYWGGGAKDGNYFLYIGGEDKSVYFPSWPDTIHLIKQAKISLKLSKTLSEEKRYKLSFFIKDTPPPPFCFLEKQNYISVGISNYEDQFGTHLIITNYGDTIWKEYIYVFETQNAEEFVTVKVGINDTIDYDILIDDFVLVETTEPLTTAINEAPQQKKQLLKIVDILGKESQPNKKGLLFYIYSDGTVEKKIIVQ